MTLTLDNWEFEPDATNDRIIIRSLDTNEEYYLNEDGTTNVDADTLRGNAPDDLSAGITSTQHVTTFEEPYVSISDYDAVIGGSIDTDVDYFVPQASYNNVSFDVSGQDSIGQGITWNDTGSKMYIIGRGSSNIYEYDVSTAYDISTATFSVSFDVSGQDTGTQGMTWNDDGSKMYIVGADTDSIYEYDVSTAYDISTASFNVSFDVSGQDTIPRGMAWNDTGSKMYVVGSDSDSIHEYDVSTAYDISTATFSVSFDVSGQDTSPQGMALNDTGSKMYMIGNINDSIYEYDLSTAYDISTATFSVSFDVSGQDTTPINMEWNNDGSKMYMVGNDANNIYEYDVSAPTDATSIVTVDNPDDVFEWDTATFESDPAVTVNLLDESGTTLLTDIGADTDISSISSNENFKFELNFDTSSSTPSVDYLARRFVGADFKKDEIGLDKKGEYDTNSNYRSATAGYNFDFSRVYIHDSESTDTTGIDFTSLPWTPEEGDILTCVNKQSESGDYRLYLVAYHP